VARFQEVERKFDTDLGTPLPDLSQLGETSEPAELQLDATYFDTARLDLAGHNVTLRRRTGGDDAGWHLKLPAGQDERTEVRLPPGRANLEVPEALARQVRALTRGRPLIPVANLHNRRVERRLLDAQGNELAIVADDTVHAERTTNGTVDLSSWREIEVELVKGDRSFLDTVSRHLRAAGLAPSASGSKLARVLGDPALAGAAGLDGSGDGQSRTAGAVVRAHLREQVDALIAHDPGAREDRPDAVHQMRVASRRLRSALATYRRLFEPAQTEPVRAELKWLGQVLGRARDAEVLHSRLLDLLGELPRELVLGPVKRRLDLELSERQAVAHAQVVAALDGRRYFRLLDALDNLVADPPLTARAGKPAHKELPARVGHACRRVDQAAQAVATAPTPRERDHALHEVRKSAKRARYAAESAAPVAGKPARRLAKRMEAVQDILGEHQDTVTSRDLLRTIGLAAHRTGENAFTFGLLHAEEHARAIQAQRAYEGALGKATRKKTRRWTR
jgi:CHAD domain-containing protein